MAEFKEIIRIQPRFAPAHISLAFMTMANGDIDASVRQATDALSIDNKNADAYLARALAYAKQKKFGPCLDDVTRALELRPGMEPGSEQLYVLRGSALSALNRHREALPNYLMARRLNRSSVDAALGLCRVYMQMGRCQLACLVAEELVRIDPRDPRGYACCARIYLYVDRVEDALRAAQKAVELVPQDPEALRRLGDVYTEMQKYELALAQYDQALTLNPKDCWALLAKAELLSACPDAKYRDGSKARELAAKATQAAELDRGECFMVLATAHAECGEFEEAVRVAKQALEAFGPDFGFREGARRRLNLFEQRKPYRLERISEQGNLKPGSPSS
jgi:tetratricopeptide (TPR) repeat protein